MIVEILDLEKFIPFLINEKYNNSEAKVKIILSFFIRTDKENLNFWKNNVIKSINVQLYTVDTVYNPDLKVNNYSVFLDKLCSQIKFDENNVYLELYDKNDKGLFLKKKLLVEPLNKMYQEDMLNDLPYFVLMSSFPIYCKLIKDSVFNFNETIRMMNIINKINSVNLA
jgi:hypothetical protein